MKYFFLVWSNLKRKKLRSFFTIASVTISFLLFGFLAAIKVGLMQGSNVADADRLLTMHKVSIIQHLPVSYKARIQNIEGVAAVMHATWFGGIYQEPKNFFPQVPVEPDDLFNLYPEYELDEAALKLWHETRTGAIVGRTTADRFGWKVGDRIPIQATIWPKSDGGMDWEFDLVGIFEAKKGVDTTLLYFRYDYFDEARSELEKGEVGWYVLRVDDPEEAVRIAQEIDALFANSFAETKTDTEHEFLLSFARQIGDIGAIMTFVLIAVFFTLLLVSGNSMALSVRERYNELALLKALGFGHPSVLGLVLSESMFICLLGGSLGLTLSVLATSRMDVAAIFPVFFVPSKDLMLGIVLIFLMGLLSGLIPALQAMRLRISDGLRR